MKKNIDINSGKYLNFISYNSKETNNNKNNSINDIGYKKFALSGPNNKLKGKFSFDLSQMNKNNNNNENSILPLKKLILKEQNNFFSDLESKYNYIKNKNKSNYTDNNYVKLDFLSKRQIQIPINNIISFNKKNDYFKNNGLNSFKFFNNKNLITRSGNNSPKREFISPRDNKKINDNIEKGNDNIVLKQRNSKNLKELLVINNYKYIEPEAKNILKSKSEINNINNFTKKLILPKMEFIKPKKLYKIKTLKNEALTEKCNKIPSIFNKKFNIPKLILNKRKDLLDKFKALKEIKHGIKMKIGSLSITGTNLNMNKLNQDTYFILPDIKSRNFSVNKNFIQIFGIFDGHGEYGDILSKEIKDYFFEYFNKIYLENPEKSFENLYKNNYEELYDLFKKLDNQLHQKYSKENNNIDVCYNSGTTANIVILFNNKIISINLGHSKSIIVFKDNKIIQLNQCHIPDSEEEKERIEKNGGEIRKEDWTDMGPKRIVYKNDKSKRYSGLAISRSLGDFYSEKIGVISIPEIKDYDIDFREIKIMIIGTAGIWEFLTNEKVRDIILTYYNENNINGGIDKLINTAKKMWSIKNPHFIDDLSVIVVFFYN